MTNKPLCIIVDDEKQGLKALRSNIEDIDLLEIERAFVDPEKFLVQIDNLKADIVFLDIEMTITGIEIVPKLKNKLIVFVSGSTISPQDVFDVSPVDFVKKPISQSRLKEAIVKVLKLYKNREDSLVIKSQDSKKEEIKFNNIAYIETSESQPRDKSFILLKGAAVIAKDINFETLINTLPNGFLKINKSQLVNLDYVTKLIDVDTIGIEFEGNYKELNLGNSYKENFFLAKPQFR